MGELKTLTITEKGQAQFPDSWRPSKVERHTMPGK